MTTKELLYIEDALGHEKFFKDQCKEAALALKDSDLKNFVNQLETKHSDMFNKFYNLIEEASY